MIIHAVQLKSPLVLKMEKVSAPVLYVVKKQQELLPLMDMHSGLVHELEIQNVLKLVRMIVLVLYVVLR